MSESAVATPHPAAAAAAREILLRGGNAIDAAVGAMLACCVVSPGAVGLGGYGGSLAAYLADRRRTIAIDFDSRAPRAYRPEIFGSLAQHYERGHLSITVPAVVAGLELALERFGTQSWAAVSAPALELAQRGVPMTVQLKQQLEQWALKADPTSRRALLSENTVPEVGAIWQQPDLAKLLAQLADEGPRAFYEGEIPTQIVRQVRAGGGILAEEDFELYRPELVEPLAIDYRGYRVLTPPPPSGGITSLQILKVLEQFEIGKLEPWRAEYFHLFAEATKVSWQDRATYFGDPEITSIPIDRLLSEATAKDKAAQIKKHIAAQSAFVTSPSPSHTANIVVADRLGNVVSVTATQGYLYGSQVAIDGLGLVMGHGMSRFDLTIGSPNSPAPGKRMFHNMAPMIVLGADERPWAGLGMPGGPKIVTVTAQLVVSLVDFKVPPQVAVSAPRVHVEADEPIAVSASVSPADIEQLRAWGHTVTLGQTVGGQPDEIGGKANVIVIDPKTQNMSAASQAGDAAALTFDLNQ